MNIHTIRMSTHYKILKVIDENEPVLASTIQLKTEMAYSHVVNIKREYEDKGFITVERTRRRDEPVRMTKKGRSFYKVVKQFIEE